MTHGLPWAGMAGRLRLAARQALATAPGAKRCYSPLPSWEDIRALERAAALPLPESLPGIDLRPAAQIRLLRDLRPYYTTQPFTARKAGGLRYHFDNPFFGHADAILLHCLLRHLKPRRIIEVGSGFSSAVILDTVDLVPNWSIEVTFIEPHPERLTALLLPGDRSRITLVREPVQSASPSLFGQLQAGDMLVIDSTHVAKLSSDVNHLVFEILPRLGHGVYVHFHDVFYPFEYPPRWAKAGRAWNEAYILRAFLSFNPAYEIVLFNDFLAKRCGDALARDFPLCLCNTGGSIWLRRARPTRAPA